MIKIAICGVGKYIDNIELCMKKEVEVLFYIDNDERKQEQERKGRKIYSLKKAPLKSIEYMVIAAYKYTDLEKQLLASGVKQEQIIVFFADNFKEEIFFRLFDEAKALRTIRECTFDYRICRLEERQNFIQDNLMYEVADMLRKNMLCFPRISTVEETVRKIVDEKVSMSRYGDGEFQIILGSAKEIYQTDDKRLARRLKEILHSSFDGHIVALADDYGCMEGLRKENKDVIRSYMTYQKRQEHYSLIDMNKQYYNAYISRPYVIYPHEEREKASERFRALRKIWDNQDIVMIEGDKTRMGVGNDLFLNAQSVKRIICPNTNAFAVYGRILEEVCKLDRENLILIALGPTATVLAYDLAKQGYWALDIGHLDLEYEWYLKGEGYSRIPGKYNNEVPGGTEVEEIDDVDYRNSIIKMIGV